MTIENKKIWEKINRYAEEVLGDIDPQKTKISVQLDALRPVMEEIAEERSMKLEDVFILYMDLASEAGVEAENKVQEEFGENGAADFSGIANRLL